MKQFKLVVLALAVVVSSVVQANSFGSLLDEAPDTVNPVRQVLIGAGMACGSRLISKAAYSDQSLGYNVADAKKKYLQMGAAEGVAGVLYDVNASNKANSKSLWVTKLAFRAVGFGLGTAGLLILFPIKAKYLPVHG